MLCRELYGTGSLWTELARAGVTAHDRSDCALVLHLYEQVGPRFIHQLQGSFVAAIWDARAMRLVIANDRFGLYPLYYAHHRGRLLFAPEMKAIRCDAQLQREIDRAAFAEYVRFQHVLGDKTFFTDIHLLGNASVLTYDARLDRLTAEPYWDPGRLADAPRSLRLIEAAEEAGRLLENAVGRCASGPLRVGVQLSGGVDARAVLGFARRHVDPVTLTFGQPGCADVVYAERLARVARARHHHVPFRDGAWVRDFADFHFDLTEGEHSWIHAHGISTLATQRTLFDVNLSGYGGGERAFTSPPALLDAVDDAAFTAQLFELLTQNATWPGLLRGERARQRQWFNPAMVDSLWRRLQCGREPNIIGKVAPLMTWELVQRRFCDDDADPIAPPR